ncbi:MAG: methyltransferase [Clostridium sp.]
MEKILIEVYLPAVGESFEVYIPLDSNFYDVTLLVSQALSELSNGLFKWRDDCVLCHRESGKVFNINLSARELGLINGSKLMLI